MQQASLQEIWVSYSSVALDASLVGFDAVLLASSPNSVTSLMNCTFSYEQPWEHVIPRDTTFAHKQPLLSDLAL
jgi:hypothetical protein